MFFLKRILFFFFIFLFFPSSFRTKWMERFSKFCLYSWRVVHREEWGDPLREETLFKNHLCLRLNILTLASTVCTPTRYCFKSAMGQLTAIRLPNLYLRRKWASGTLSETLSFLYLLCLDALKTNVYSHQIYWFR